MENKSNLKFSVGYAKQCVTPEIGTWLGGYGNGKDRPSIGKIIEDDDLYITAVAITDAEDKTIIVMTVDLSRMPNGGYNELLEKIEEETGVPKQNIMLSATHSHSTPEFIDGVKAMENFRALFMEQGLLAAKNALCDRKEAEAYVGIREVNGLNFVRRYMKNGEFIGTNHGGGDAHETKSDNRLQIIKFVRDGAKDVLLMNWGAHPDHSKDIGGDSGTPEFHRGCSADYIYSLRKTLEEKAGVCFAFFEAAAGNLNAKSLLPGEHTRVEERAEKEGVKRFVAYGETLADEVLELLKTPLTKVNAYKSMGVTSEIDVDRHTGAEIGSPDYNKAYAVAVITFASKTLEKPTAESLEAAQNLMEKFELGDYENVKEILKDENHPFYTHALCVKVLTEGGKMPFSNESTRNCAIQLARLFHFTSGPYATNQLITHSNNNGKPPYKMPLYAVSCGDIAFAGAPGEIFDTNGAEVKDSSPFKMTFFIEFCGGSYGYFPSKLAWSHGGYEVDSTTGAEGTGEKISAELSKMLKEMKAKQ